MTPYATKHISKEEIALFMHIKRAIEEMVDPDLGLDEDGEEILLSCHMLARAVARIFPVKVRDGYFASHFDHSWVETPEKNLIDLYPAAAIGGPIMFDGVVVLRRHFVYVCSTTRALSRGRFSKNSFRRSVSRVTKALRTALRGSEMFITREHKSP